MKRDRANFVFDHLFFPPQLPQVDHKELGADEILRQVSRLARVFSDEVGTDSARRVWTHLARSTEQWIDIYSSGSPCSSIITTSLKNMRIDDVLMFYIKSQNATIIARHRGTGVVFECFEVVPKMDAVMKVKDALVRSFPARAVFIPKPTMAMKAFVDELATAIHGLSVEQLQQSTEVASKAGNVVAEDRQSRSPKFVSEWLFGAVLSAYGNAISSQTVSKRTHDDVLSKGVGMPWRRSGVWLSVKVTLQLALLNSDLDDMDNVNYKNFMLFLLANIATQLLSTNLHPTTLHVLRVKLARRNAKLGQDTFKFVQNYVQKTLSAIHAAMQENWAKAIQADKATIPSVNGRLAHDQLCLTNSRKHLHMVWERSQRPFAYSQTQYNPPLSPRIQLSDSNLPGPDVFAQGGDPLTCLGLVELWVEDHLGAWLNLNTSYSSACRQLYELMDAYYLSAITTYRGYPERSSHMFLTIFELWVAIDVISTSLHPLLLEYSPEIQVNHLEPLLLGKKAALARLARVELHIQTRQQHKSTQSPSIFSDPSEHCFAVKFYEHSEQMQALRLVIENEAQGVRDQKLEEWRAKKLQFELLMRDAKSMECGVFIYRGIDPEGKPYTARPRHDRRCRRCELEGEANSIEIAKHEWPLPQDEVQCKAVVFEMGPPEAFISWRDSTWFVLHKLSRVDINGEASQQNLLSYSPLAKYVQNNDRQVTLASSVKPMINTHYLKGGLSVHTILLHNGLVLRLQGPGSQRPTVWTEEQRPSKVSIRQHCQSRLAPNAPMHLVQQINFTSHNHNQVLAMQSKCPPDMGPHEHILFGSLRSDEQLQFIRLLAMIMSSEVDINSDSTAVLITHTISEAGKRSSQLLGDSLRVSQLDLLNQSFCNALLNAVEEKFSSIEANWKEATAAGVLLSILLTVLSLCLNVEVSERCLGLISRIRQASLEWIRQLAESYRNKRTVSAKGGNLKEFSRQILSSSLLARRTFNLDRDRQQLEFSKLGAVADYVEASINLHEHKDQGSGTSDRMDETNYKQQTELLNDAYHARQCESLLLLALLGDGRRISDGIRRFWHTASFAGSWQLVNDNDTSWIENYSTNQIVHYNLVTGSLLVSGKPLSRLPTGYTNHPLYRSIFADLDLEVFTSDSNDMEYMSRVHYQGHQIYFAKREESLLIRSRHGTDTYEAIPREIFVGDLPEPLFKKSLPWMSLSDGKVSFRRHDRAWSSYDDDWTLCLDIEPRTTTSMHSNIGYLVDNSSNVGQRICSIFQPLEEAKYIVIFKSNDEVTGVQIKLPRYHLNFSLQLNGDIKCKELSAIIDHSQSVGTLHGLKSKLAFRAANNVSAESLRTILIPNGDVAITSAPPHVEVHIRPGTGENLTFSRYRLDGLLGQLVSDDPEAHLFKTYLHAITSFPEPDPFTSRNGTEEALWGLSDHITRTSVPLSARARELLGLIAGLSPSRRFYPKGLQIMQTVAFHKDLSVLTQQDIFFRTVEGIILHNSRANFLFEHASVDLPRYPGDMALLERSQYRTSKLFANASLTDTILDTGDLQYQPRDLLLSPAQEHAFSMATLAAIGKSSFDVDPQIKALVRGWKDVSGFQQKFSVLSISGVLSKPLKEQWAPLLSWCKKSPSKASLAFLLSLMIYGNPGIGPQLRTLLAFSVSARLKDLPAPDNDSYDLRDGHTLNQEEIAKILHECEEQPSAAFDDEDSSEAHTLFVTETAAQRDQIMEAVESSWPGSKVELPGKDSLSHYAYGKLKVLIDGRFGAWYRNHNFLSLCDDYDQRLEGFKSSWTAPGLPAIVLQHPMHQRDCITCPSRLSLLAIMKSVHVTDVDFSKSSPSKLDQDLAAIITATQRKNLLGVNEFRVAREGLEEIVEDLEADPAEIVQNYGKAIKTSLEALEKNAGSKTSIKPPSQMFLQEQIKVVQTRIGDIFHRCKDLLSPCLRSELGLEGARLWPSISYLTLLQLLSAEHRPQLSDSWMKVILRFAEEITALQRLERMQKYLAANDTFALSKELANRAHAEWSTADRPDWLLLEIQNRILIRPEQIRIAHKIMEPKSGVVLADMGIGKSSTILPMVVTALADGSSLVRVIVLKPLANEMLRILSRSLSGLVGRAVYFLPVSRQTTLAGANPQQLREIYECCAKNAGVLVSLPEHLNSFRLLCNDKLHTKPNLAHELFGIQQYLDRTARDVIDESDQVLEPGYELVYTTGESLILSKSPERWIVALEVLDLIQQNVGRALEKTPIGLELERRATDAFDHVRILDEAGAQALMTSLVDAVLQGRLPSVPLGHCNPEVLEALTSFIQDANVRPEALMLISTHFEGSDQLDILYVVRGLVSCQILTHALRKRWLVDYGLDRSRPGDCLAAVPYRAKAVPSQSSEFAQPETMIILTALSYYYTGLRHQEVRQCLILLLRLPDPSEEFSKWVNKSRLPDTYRNASSINLDDASCLEILYQHLQLNKAAIEFFLKHKVFPKEAREFNWKLSSSAWDLCASDNVRVVTGFSGTCDSRIPFSVEQKQIQNLRHSTASTLATILRNENRQYICASSHGQRLSTEEMLDLIVGQDKERSVIIDVGAQFLEDNKVIATKWLNKCKKKMAAIYFSNSDEKMVLNHDGTTEEFNSSTFKDEIGSCLIYLDEFHTRGTDFQLPDSFFAAVLLGPRIPKDALVQACMRMRKLATTQSVIFIAPPEVDQSIRAVTKTPSGEISSFHVVRWAIHQSCLVLKYQHTLCTIKGLQHSRRRIAAARHIHKTGSVTDSKTYLATIRERESRPVSEMYRIDQSRAKKLPFKPSQKERDDEIMANQLIEWQRIDTADFEDSGIFEEQEREVLHEVEEEREIQRPGQVLPAYPTACHALLDLIRDGTLCIGSDGILPAFEVLKKTRLAPLYSQALWPAQIYATADFIRTIVPQGNSPQDDFLRPVQWVLHAKRINGPIIISPHEANIFLALIRESKRVSLFLYQARVSKSMSPFDKLDVYKIPEEDNGATFSQEQVAVLNLFAGQLYFSTFDNYKVLCTLIGLWDGERELPIRRKVANDNWVAPSCRSANGWNECTFISSPVQHIKTFINMRRLGIEWSHTHMGRILAGKILSRLDFEDEDATAPVAAFGSLKMA